MFAHRFAAHLDPMRVRAQPIKDSVDQRANVTMKPKPERRDFWEIAEDRYHTRSMILTSQLPVCMSEKLSLLLQSSICMD